MDGEEVEEIEGECELVSQVMQLAFQVTQICLHYVIKFFIVILFSMYIATITTCTTVSLDALDAPEAVSNEAHVTWCRLDYVHLNELKFR